MQAPSRDEQVNLHFIAFVEVDGKLYELGELTHSCRHFVVIQFSRTFWALSSLVCTL